MQRFMNLLQNPLDGVWYFCMTEMPGVPLSTLVDNLPTATLQTIAADLSAVLSTLHGIRSESDLVASVTKSNPLSNMLVPCIAQPQHLLTYSNFRHYINELLAACGTTPSWRADILKHIPSQGGQVVFTHGDLLPKNILVDPEHSYRVSAILDWENSGFYPDYWEAARMNNPGLMTPGWERILGFLFPEKDRREKLQGSALDEILGYIDVHL